MSSSSTLHGWAILELMSHRRLSGYLSEAEIAGARFLRIDVPVSESSLEAQFYAPASVYAITPTNEATARALASQHRPEPVLRWEVLPETTDGT